jgi:hypothetical protein
MSRYSTKPKELERQLAAFVADQNWMGLGNWMLEILTAAHQEQRPDAAAHWLAGRLDEILTRRFDLPARTPFPCPYRDRYLSHADRGSWAKDAYVFLLIAAYVVGASRENLPPPHDQLVPFYQKTAAEQAHLIAAAAARTREVRKKAPPAKAAEAMLALAARLLAQIESQIFAVQHSGLDPHLIDEELQSLAKQKQALLDDIKNLEKEKNA